MAKHERETIKSGKSGKSSEEEPPASQEPRERLPKKPYEAELYRLQGELVKVQEWMRTSGAADRDHLRGPRRGRQGRHDQAGARST